MVEFGSKLAKEHGFANLEYRLGDIEDPPIAKGTIDLAILSQALHHAIHPERAITSASSDFEKGGRIVVLDLTQPPVSSGPVNFTPIIGSASARWSCTSS